MTFAAIQDFEGFALRTDEGGFFRTLAAAKEQRFFGWILPNVRDAVEASLPEGKRYPFDLGALLAWWRDLERVKEKARQP